MSAPARTKSCIIVEGTEPICSCCGVRVSEPDVQMMIVRDAFEKNVVPPDEYSKKCYALLRAVLKDRPIISWSAIVYFCKTCVPQLPGGTNAFTPKS